MRKNSKKIFWQIFFAGLSGILLFLSFPLPKGVSLGGFAWVGLIGLFLALKDVLPRRGFLLGLFCGVISWLGILYWIPYCMTTYASMSGFLAGLALVLLVLILSFYLAFFSWGYVWFRKNLQRVSVKFSVLWLGIFATCWWVVLEYLRSFFPFGGFAWTLLGLSQYKFLSLIQIADLGGIWLVSGLVFFANYVFFQLVFGQERYQERVGLLIIFLVLLASSLIYGRVRLSRIEQSLKNQPKLRIGIVQPNIDQSIKWSPEYFWASISLQENLTRKLLKEPKDLIIWPEASVTTYFNLSWEQSPALREVLSQFPCYLLFGSISKEMINGEKKYFNSVYLLAPYGKEILGRYDKIHLVPFGEYVPLQKILFWVDAIAGGATGNTTSGREIKVLNSGKFRIGSVICYELIFPELVRKFVKEGAELMSTVTNDAWFGSTSAPFQHFANMVFRAVENRIYFLRSANTGISGVVAPSGRIIAQSSIFQIETLSSEVRLGPIGGISIYTRFGAWFVWLCLFLTALLVVIILAKRLKLKEVGG